MFYIVKKWDTFQKGQPMIGLEMMIGDVLERKEDFLDFKNVFFI